jgi:4'-phosphopantetheinyl transferase
MTDWTSPLTLPILLPETIHIWRLHLPDITREMAYYLKHLSTPEQTACLRFTFPELQRRYAIVRFGLRYLLAHYCKQSLTDIELAIGKQGKPYLPNHSIHFNLSHSGDYALYAFSNIPDILLGIDVERITHRHELAIAKRFFTPAEYAQLAALPLEQQAEAFFHIWTQKEAFIKAIGQGLSYSLDRFETSVTGPAQLVFIEDPTYHALHWQSTHIDLDTAYKACITYSQSAAGIQCLKLSI